MRRTPIALAVLAGGAVYALALRPRLLQAGSTGEEARRPLPGDELVPAATGQSTMGVTIDAPPEEVWPWLVQMGCGRAGWYSFDRLDNGGVPSADRIVPELQELAVGDRLAATPDGRMWFEVAALEPERVLALRANVDVLRRRSYEPTGPRPSAFSEGMWTFVLEPQAGKTRVLVRTRGRERPRALLRLANLLFWEPAHVVMQQRQFRNLKRLVEQREVS